MNESLPPIADLLPHEGPMCMLDRLFAVDCERLIADVVVPADGLFSRDGHVGAWVGVEYMAQAVAAWVGWQSRAVGQAPRIGFLLGTRRYHCSVPRFAAGQCLRVEIWRNYQADNGLGQFDCTIREDDAMLASAQVTVFGPADPVAFLNGDNP